MKKSGNEERMKAEDGPMLIEKEAVKEKKAEYYEGLLKLEEDREAEIVVAAIGIENGIKVLITHKSRKKRSKVW